MAPTTPYSFHLEGRDPLATMSESASRFEKLAGTFSAERYAAPIAPGKWTIVQILTHLAQTEIALGSRARYALSTPDYASQNFDQDRWLRWDSGLTGPQALQTLVTLIRMNHAMYSGLSPAELDTRFTHPEYGAISVDWILHQQAGHHLHHLKQLEAL